MKTLKDGEKKADTLVMLELRDDTVVFLGFSLCFIYAISGSEEASNPEPPTSTEQKSPLSLDKGPGKGQPSKTGNF